MKTRKICSWALKGGAGKTFVAANLGYALQRVGHKIGFTDADVTGPKLPGFLGMTRPYPYPKVDVEKVEKYPALWNGFEVYSLAFEFDGAVMLKGGEEKIRAFGHEYEIHGTGIYNLVKNTLEHLKYSDDLDYLIYDLPPSTSDSVLSLFENIKDLYGVILVCQPTGQAIDDMERAVDLLIKRRLPVIGMVGNMTHVSCPACSHEFYPFAENSINLVQFCKDNGIPYLMGVPLTRDKYAIDVQFDLLAKMVDVSNPIKLSDVPLPKRLGQMVLRKAVESMVNNTANE